MPLCGAWVALDRLADVGHEICFGASRPTRWTDHFSSDHIEVDHERQRALADVLELAPLDFTGSQRQARRGTLQRLDTGHLVRADGALPGCPTRRSLVLRGTDIGNLLTPLFGRLVARGW